MLRLKCKITFTPKPDLSGANSVTSTQLINQTASPLEQTRQEIVFDFVNSVEIHSSFEDLTSTAKIVIPRKLKFNGKAIATELNSIFRRGDKVKIELGYHPNLRTVFEGYINRVSINAPITIECEDAMFKLKQKHIIWPLKYSTVTKGKRGKKLAHPKVIPTKIKLKELIQDVFLEGTGINFECVDTEINVIRFDSSVAKCLEEIKSQYGLQSYFRDEILHVGFASDASQTNVVDFEFEKNIIEDSNLTYQQKDDVILQVRAESIDSKTNKRETVVVGDDFGEHRDFKIQNATKAELLKFAQEKLNETKYEGFRGTFLTLGENYVKPGDAAQLTSRKYPEKNGVYQIKSVTRSFGMGGYRQNIELSARLNF